MFGTPTSLGHSGIFDHGIQQNLSRLSKPQARLSLTDPDILGTSQIPDVREDLRERKKTTDATSKFRITYIKKKTKLPRKNISITKQNSQPSFFMKLKLHSLMVSGANL